MRSKSFDVPRNACNQPGRTRAASGHKRRICARRGIYFATPPFQRDRDATLTLTLRKVLDGPRQGRDYAGNLRQFPAWFPSEKACERSLVKLRWGDGLCEEGRVHGSTLHTDAWPAHELFPRVHRVAALVKRWLAYRDLIRLDRKAA